MEDSPLELKQSRIDHVRTWTGFSLKIIGVMLMVFDHVYEMFYMFGVPEWFHMLGRPVAPIFLFLASEAFFYTRDRKKYMLRLLAGFWFMSLVSLLLERLLPISGVALTNSIFGTLFLAVFYMWMAEIVIRGFREKAVKPIVFGLLGALVPIALAALAMLLTDGGGIVFRVLTMAIPNPLVVEGGFVWIVLGLGFYLARNNRFAQIVILCAVALLTLIASGGYQWLMALAAIPIFFYDGRLGRPSKWFFYIFYPAHIYALYVLSYILH